MSRKKLRLAQVSIRACAEVAVPGPVTVAADASRLPDHSSLFTTGYLATSGQYGLHALPSPMVVTGRNDSLIAELRALARAERSIVKGQPVVFLTDNREAAEFAQAWLAGGDEFPSGYRLFRVSGAKPSLAVFAGRLAAHPDLYTVQWVKGHAGHPLNETADSLARLAARTARGMFTLREAQRLSGQYATGTLRALGGVTAEQEKSGAAP